MELGSNRSGRGVNVGRPGKHIVVMVIRVSFQIRKEAITVKQLLLIEYLLMCQVLWTHYF